MVLPGQENNLPRHCVTDKDWYIHVVVLYTQTDLRYGLVDQDERNVLAYRLHALNFQIPFSLLNLACCQVTQLFYQPL